MVSNAILSQQLQVLHGRIDTQIRTIEKVAEKEDPTLPNIYHLRYPDGTYVMPQLLAAQATVLNAMALLRRPVS